MMTFKVRVNFKIYSDFLPNKLVDYFCNLKENIALKTLIIKITNFQTCKFAQKLTQKVAHKIAREL